MTRRSSLMTYAVGVNDLNEICAIGEGLFQL